MSKMVECQNCDGTGYELEEQDVSVGSDPHREPDFQLVGSDEICLYCNGHG